MTLPKNIVKKAALTQLELLKKEVKGIDADLDKLESHLTHLPLFHRTIYKSQEKALLQVYYGSMTLTFCLKNGNIELLEKVDLWNEDGVGYIGTFTPKTLKLECESGLD